MAAPPSRHYPVTDATTTIFRTWMCVVCGFIYHETDGLPEEGIAPGTRWEDIPDDFPGHPLGRHPRRLDLSRLRREQGGFRDGGAGLSRSARAL